MSIYTYVSMLACIALVLDKMGSEWLEKTQKTLILNFLIFENLITKETMTHNMPRQVMEYDRVPRGYLERYVHVKGLGTSDVATRCIAEGNECM